MKNLKSFVEYVNEAKKVEWAKDQNSTPLQTTIDQYAEEGETLEEGPADIKLMTKQFTDIAHALKGNLKNIVSDMEEGSYELCKALSVGLDKRRRAGDTNIKLVNEVTFLSPFKESSSKQVMSHYHIADIKIDVMTWEDGDDYSDFAHFACLQKDLKKLVYWVNKNMSEDDMTY